MAPCVEFDVVFTNDVCERVSVSLMDASSVSARFRAVDRSRPSVLSWHFGPTAEQCASSWAAGRMTRLAGAGIASIRRVEVKRAWSVLEARDMGAWRTLVLAAVAPKPVAVDGPVVVARVQARRFVGADGAPLALPSPIAGGSFAVVQVGGTAGAAGTAVSPGAMP